MSFGGPMMKERRRGGAGDPNSAKPLTPFSIEDILSRPPCKRTPTCHQGTPKPGAPQQASPLCALQDLATKTFQGLEVTPVLQAAQGRDPLGSLVHRPSCKKRRKSRTAFTNHQIYELEKRFLYQKYLSPADRDHLAQTLGLSNAQVITWFQNRRAKLKRDLEEMKADVESLKKLPPHALERLVTMPEDEEEEDEEDEGRGSSPNSQALNLQSPHCTAQDFSEEEEIEVDV